MGSTCRRQPPPAHVETDIFKGYKMVISKAPKTITVATQKYPEYYGMCFMEIRSDSLHILDIKCDLRGKGICSMILNYIKFKYALVYTKITGTILTGKGYDHARIVKFFKKNDFT